MSIRIIQEKTAAAWGISLVALTGAQRLARLTLPRQAAMYLAYKAGGYSFAQIGRAFGRDHSTVAHNVEAMRRRMAEEPDLARKIEALSAEMFPLIAPDNATALAEMLADRTRAALLDLAKRDPIGFAKRVAKLATEGVIQ